MGLQVFLKDGRAKLVAEVEDDDGQLANPTAVVFTVKDPSGNLDVVNWPGASVDNPEPGVFETSLPLDEAGRWGAHVRTAGTITAVAEEFFRVEESHVVA